MGSLPLMLCTLVHLDQRCACKHVSPSREIPNLGIHANAHLVFTGAGPEGTGSSCWGQATPARPISSPYWGLQLYMGETCFRKYHKHAHCLFFQWIAIRSSFPLWQWQLCCKMTWLPGPISVYYFTFLILSYCTNLILK
jgi:hypothetical protein